MIRKASKNDIRIIANMEILMWTDNSVDDLADEFLELITKDTAQIILWKAAAIGDMPKSC